MGFVPSGRASGCKDIYRNNLDDSSIEPLTKILSSTKWTLDECYQYVLLIVRAKIHQIINRGKVKQAGVLVALNFAMLKNSTDGVRHSCITRGSL